MPSSRCDLHTRFGKNHLIREKIAQDPVSLLTVPDQVLPATNAVQSSRQINFPRQHLQSRGEREKFERVNSARTLDCRVFIGREEHNSHSPLTETRVAVEIQ